MPLKDGKVVEDMRIRASLPTINYLIEHGAKKIVLLSHLGRPNGQENPELSLRPVATRLAELMPKRLIAFVDMSIEGSIETALQKSPKDGGIILLENLRFWPEEEANSEEFARKIIERTKADVFVQDGFAVIHRAHASTDAMARLLPSVAGLLVEKEVSNLEGAISNPEHPVLVIIGGAKVADKQPMIDRFLPIADKIAVGGKIAADGYEATDEKIFVAKGFAENADEPKSSALARAIRSAIRSGKAPETTTDLRNIVYTVYGLKEETPGRWVPAGKKAGRKPSGKAEGTAEDPLAAAKKACARVFQALRIDVNREFEVLYEFLEKLPDAMKPGGRIAILTFHSGEDRLVKKAFKAGYQAGIYAKIADDVIRPSSEECVRNPRARSTKLRWAVRA